MCDRLDPRHRLPVRVVKQKHERLTCREPLEQRADRVVRAVAIGGEASSRALAARLLGGG